MILGIIIGLVVLVFLIVVHELGHAIAARRNGVVVEEFGIGFPPRAWGKRLKNGILFSINWLPIGGFVKLKGEYDSATGKGTYGGATFWQKTKILLAGVLVNWLVAALLLTILAWTGLPKILDTQFTVAGDTRIEASPVTLAALVKGGAAEKSGFKKDDQIVAINGKKIADTQTFITETKAHAGQSVEVTYQRDGQEARMTMALGNNPSKGVFGASLGQREYIHATWSAPLVGVGTTAQLSWETLKGLGELVGKLSNGIVGQFSGSEHTREQAREQVDEVSQSVAGPVGILGVIFPSAQQQGVTQIVLLTAMISLTLAVMNTLPIPALDGGRWWTMAIFRVLKKKLTKEREETIQGIGFLVLMGLIVLITVADVGKFWS